MPNPVVEVQYSITLQVWVTAVPLARAGKLLPISNVKDGSQHFVLGYTDEFTLTAAYNRRAKPGVGNPSDAFWFQFDRKDFKAPVTINFQRNIGNSKPPTRRPVVNGQLAVEPARAWLRASDFNPS